MLSFEAITAYAYVSALAFIVFVAPENPVPAALVAFGFASLVVYIAWLTLGDKEVSSSTGSASSPQPPEAKLVSSHTGVIQQSKARVAEVVAYNRSVQTISSRHNQHNPVRGLVYKAAVQLHYESFTTANRWHTLSQELSASIGFMKREIAIINREIHSSGQRRASQITTLPVLKAALEELKATKQELITQQQIANDSVLRLNENTARLRDAIAISYGEQGRLWFQRLEERKKLKRSI